MNNRMMIAVSGKGGVGKTTLSSLFCHVLTKRGYSVLAIDADPDANLGMALGFSEDTLGRATTIAQDRELLAASQEHVHPHPEPHWFDSDIFIEEIPEKYLIEHNGIKLVQLGAITAGGAGCVCSEHSFLRTLLANLLIRPNEAIIVDMEAGLEHLGRGTAGAVDAFIVVVEPGQRSFATAKAVARLADDLGVRRIYAVASKVRDVGLEAIQTQLGDVPVIGAIPYMAEAVQADLEGKPLFDHCPAIVEIVGNILDSCQARMVKAG